MPNEVTEAITRIAAEALNNPPGDAMSRRDMILACRAAMRAADTPPVGEVEWLVHDVRRAQETATGLATENERLRDALAQVVELANSVSDLKYVAQTALTPVANPLTEGQLLSDKGEVERLREAAQFVLDQRASTYRARNGRDVGIQDESGEKVWLVPFDAMADLERALAALRPHNEAVVEGGE